MAGHILSPFARVTMEEPDSPGMNTIGPWLVDGEDELLMLFSLVRVHEKNACSEEFSLARLENAFNNTSIRDTDCSALGYCYVRCH
jgi:hypothetical protein